MSNELTWTLQKSMLKRLCVNWLTFLNTATDSAEYYGFLLDNNPHDRAKLPLELLPRALQDTLNGESCWLHPSGLPSWEFMKELRLWAANVLGCRCLNIAAACPYGNKIC